MRLLGAIKTMSEQIVKRNGLKLIVDESQNDHIALDEIFTLNEYRITFPNRDIPPPILDIGAHKGYFTCLCASHGTRVVSYEPNPKNFSVLQENLRLNGLTAEIHNQGVWKEPANVRLHLNPTSGGNHSLYHNGHVCYEECEEPSVAIPCEGFNSIIGDTNWAFVKIDCEGAEYEIILSATDKSLSLIDTIAMELHGPVMLQEKLYQPMLDRLSQYFLLRGESQVGDTRFRYLYGEKR
jgi:FkbM family methyltransferase